MKSKYLLILLFSLQSVLIFIAFRPFFLQPHAHLLQNTHDGMKNYFTYYSYLTDQQSANFFEYHQMNYPYGDYIFYTDNTPVLSLTVKFISAYIVDLTPYAFPIYNYFFILSILLTTLFAYLILKRFISNQYLLFFLAITLAWLNPQTTRLLNGHVNLSLAWLLLCNLYLLIRWYEAMQVQPNHKSYAILGLMSLQLIFSAFFHLYYLPILGVNILFFAFIWGLSEYRQPKQLLKIGVMGGITVGIALVTVLGIIKGIDGYYDLRRTVAEGYGFDDWKLLFDSLFTAYPWLSFKFPIGTTKGIHYESYAYLGGFALYGLIVILLIWKWKRQLLPSVNNTTFINTDHKKWNRQLIICLVGTGILGVLVALGNSFPILGGNYIIQNYLNPFRYGEILTERLHQFRCLARFSWTFFWIFNLLIAVLIDQFILKSKIQNPKSRNKIPTTLLLLFLLFATVTDTYSTVRLFKKHQTQNDLIDKGAQGDIKQLTKNINFNDYQAILSIPLFHVGSENYEYTMDPEDWFCTQSFQLSILSGLPLMSSKMSRTAVDQAKAMFSIFLDQPIAPDLLAQLQAKDKPILVFYNPNIVRDKLLRPAWKTAAQAYDNSAKTIEKYGMVEIASYGHLKLYRWEVQ